MPPAASRALACRLRVLREDAGLTQARLATVLGGHKPLSVSLISSWENGKKPVTPPIRRLEAYATLFASRRSLDGATLRVLPVDQLTDEERVRRGEILEELLWLRENGGSAPATPGTDIWTFEVNQAITIVCAPLPEKYRRQLSFADPGSAGFGSLYSYANLDALVELFGYIRSRNPENNVKFCTSDELEADDYVAHLVLLGGVDFTSVTRAVLERVELPVRQVPGEADADHGGFLVAEKGDSKLFGPMLDSQGHLLEDVGFFCRDLSPFNRKRTLTVCNGVYGRGTLGAVRALTDARVRDRNTGYVRERFGELDSFSILSRVPVIDGQGLTPDWTLQENRLHEWPEAP